jgi:hypothetical protein
MFVRKGEGGGCAHLLWCEWLRNTQAKEFSFFFFSFYAKNCIPAKSSGLGARIGTQNSEMRTLE